MRVKKGPLRLFVNEDDKVGGVIDIFFIYSNVCPQASPPFSSASCDPLISFSFSQVDGKHWVPQELIGLCGVRNFILARNRTESSGRQRDELTRKKSSTASRPGRHAETSPLPSDSLALNHSIYHTHTHIICIMPQPSSLGSCPLIFL
nr:uncharacterized protein LOC109151377 [Ipomoea batatas]